jgi:hypothetical protein
MSALLNAVFTNFVIGYFNPFLLVDIQRVLRYVIGDIIGSFTVIAGLMAIFTTLKNAKLIVPTE